MTELADNACFTCDSNTPPVSQDHAEAWLVELGSAWQVNEDGHLERLFIFKNFMDAMAFANRVGDVAEEQSHHPDLHIGWGRCGVEIWTHAIGGLSKSDFYLAAKVNRAHNCTDNESESD